jgi:hypothetical protein
MWITVLTERLSHAPKQRVADLEEIVVSPITYWSDGVPSVIRWSRRSCETALMLSASASFPGCWLIHAVKHSSTDALAVSE